MIFMHKDQPIAEVSVNSGRFSVYKLLSDRELPVGTITQTRQLLELSLSNWYSSRAIPGLRQSLDRIERALGCSVFDALVRSMGVSLTDCYWFRPDGMESLTWKDVNYHDNGFSEDLAAVIIHGADGPVVDFRLPDLTTDGALQKGWVLLDGMPVLVKFGDFGDHAMGKNLLSANEVATYRIAQEMQIDCVEYFPLKIGNTEAVVSGCPCFITDPNSEFVSAIQIGRKMNRVGSLSLYHTLSGMGFRQELDEMLVFDHLIHNTDRHEKNFGFIRDAETLKIERFAPLFDNGSSFAWNCSLSSSHSPETKPFCETREAQLALVQRIPDIPDPAFVRGILLEVYEQFEIPEIRYQIATEDLKRSYAMLSERIRSETISLAGSSVPGQSQTEEEPER